MGRSHFRALVCLASWVAVGLVVAEGGRALPEPAKLPWIEASIRALENNGTAGRASREFGVDLPDGTRALPIKHVVDCETESVCARVARWARRAGFTPSDTVTDYGHGGVAQFQIHLRQRVPLASKQVQAEATRIHQALQQLSGTRYDTWMLDLDPEGTRVAR